MFTKHFPFELKTHESNEQQQKMDTLKTLHTKKKKKKKNPNHKVLPQDTPHVTGIRRY